MKTIFKNIYIKCQYDYLYNFSQKMVDYTLSSYEEALRTYDLNVEDLKYRSSKEMEDLVEVFNRTQKDVQNDPFLSLSEKSRTLRKRQEWFDKIKKEKEKQLKMDLEVETKNRENFIAQNWWFDYYCFTFLNEISKLKSEKLWEVDQELVKKQEELARLQAEIESKQQEFDALKWELDSIQSVTLHEAFFEFDVMPRIKKVEVDLKALVEEHKDDYDFSQDFVGRTIRCLIKECKKQKGLLNYEWWKLKLSFDTVDNWTKWQTAALKAEVLNILKNWGFVISKMKTGKSDLKEKNADINATLMSISFKRREDLWTNELYWKEVLLHLDKNDIQWRVDVFKGLWFSFANEWAFIRQVETARWEWVDLVEDIDRWIQLYLVKSGAIEPRMSDDKKQYFKISLDCRQRNPRILMTMDPSEWMKILCVAPHVDYDNILRGQTKNYFQSWKWDWIKKWKQWRKTWRA